MRKQQQNIQKKKKAKKKAAFIFCHLPLAEPGVGYSIGSQYTYKLF